MFHPRVRMLVETPTDLLQLQILTTTTTTEKKMENYGTKDQGTMNFFLVTRFGIPPKSNRAWWYRLDRVDDTGVWGTLVDWGPQYTAYLSMGSIGKEKGRGVVDMLSSTTGRDSVAIEPSSLLKQGATIRCHIGSATLRGKVVKVSKSSRKVEIHFDGPVCALLGVNIALEGKKGDQRGSFLLVAHAKLAGGDKCLDGCEAENAPGLTNKRAMLRVLRNKPATTGTLRQMLFTEEYSWKNSRCNAI
mmetsp:Transcript_3059/g.6146  ORF Transcript_3059/g.6146 Transcript_3059/m.6146 type:complete len:246 (+) Transcript_3059:11-748(+)